MVGQTGEQTVQNLGRTIDINGNINIFGVKDSSQQLVEPV